MKRDERWSVFTVPDTYQEFCASTHCIPEIRLKAEVNDDVKGKFRIVRKLLEHSYYEYEFYDVAAVNAVFTFEMALNLRYTEITKEKWRKNLEKLIEWFNSRSYFEVYNPGFLEYIRQVRNNFAHQQGNHFAGPMKRHHIEYSINLINDLYEDPQLRIERMTLMRELEAKIKAINTKGLKIWFNDGSSQLAYMARPIFVNNKLSPNEIYFLFSPLFYMPKPLEHGRLYDAPTIGITANTVKYEENAIIFQDVEFDAIRIAAIDNEKDIKEFTDWGFQFAEYDRQTMHLASCNTDDTLRFNEHLKQLHFTN
jgi:hypothetical protein